jgi:cytochrome c biogenesis protein CcdA
MSVFFSVWRGWLALLAACLALAAAPALALDPKDLLPPEQAFQVEAQRVGPALRLNIRIADGYYLYRNKLALASAPAGLTAPPAWPLGKRKHDPYFGETEIYRGVFSVDVPLVGPWPDQGRLQLSLQGCADAGICYPPEQRTLTPDSRPASSWLQGGPPPAGQDTALDRLSLPALLASFFVAGLGMALTACMYPMLPIISAIVAGQGARLTRMRGLTLAFAYVQGLAFSYVLVGVAAGLTGSLLTVWLQQPAVILSAAALMVVFALAMFDVIAIQLPSAWQSRLNDASGRLGGGRLASVFAMGALSALIIGPCVAPPLAVALGYIGASGDAWLGGVALYALAMGLGAPLLVVGWCLDNGLKVIINVHHEKWLEGRPTYQYKEENCQKLALLWMNIASEFANYDSRLAFAGTNEVHIRDNWGKPTAENLEVQNAYNQIFVDMVRATGGNNAKRHLILQTYVCNPWFGIENGDFIIPKDAEGNGNNYMSVEFHYYQPWSYAGDCTYDYWGDAYKDAGKIPAENEKTMTDFFDKAVNTWSNKGLGIVIGEWGVTDHYKSNSEKVHENMTYYCKFLTTEARKRGFSTFVWDNNHFGNGSEKYGIFDRFKSMKVNAPWILEGIFGKE